MCKHACSCFVKFHVRVHPKNKDSREEKIEAEKQAAESCKAGTVVDSGVLIRVVQSMIRLLKL